ncbi:response regulator [candidate division KSB1 bacterium]|nr:response regulator [candidate division KSB1 bacterium]TDI94902.1 MAG: response regulator [Caldithrix sp.]TDI95637.1 MAG: response regulator [Caldithrix sp.]
MSKILIIEDVEEARNSIRRTLEMDGYDVITAPEGKKGLNLIQENILDLVITDIFMPEMEGLETIRRIVKSKPNLPVIVITGSIELSFLEVGLQFGAVSGLYKPFTPEKLLSAVTKALE